jgi:hypothetical protein
MTNPELKTFLESLTNDQVFAILEAARVALADADIAYEVGLELSMSDADINLIQHKVHRFMENQ